jgi:hypothetical protein
VVVALGVFFIVRRRLAAQQEEKAKQARAAAAASEDTYNPVNPGTAHYDSSSYTGGGGAPYVNNVKGTSEFDPWPFVQRRVPP